MYNKQLLHSVRLMHALGGFSSQILCSFTAFRARDVACANFCEPMQVLIPHLIPVSAFRNKS
jgi:hypothetical protein